MKLFGRKHKKNLRMAIEIGSYAMRGVVFEALKNDLPPRIVKKNIYYLPRSANEGKAVGKLREYIFFMIKELGAIPERITIGLGPHFGEQKYARWTIQNPQGLKISSGKELGSYFYNLFEQHRDIGKAIIADPTETLINGYTVNQSLLSRVESRGKSYIKELSFHTLLLSLPDSIGSQLIEAKQSLGGMPIEFVPVTAAYKEAFTKALHVSDGFLVYVGDEETVLTLLKNGELEQFVMFPTGMRHFIRGIAKLFSISLDEASDLKRQYAKGILGQSRQARLRDFLISELGIWEKNFRESLDSFYVFGPIPPQVLLFGSGAEMPEIFSFLKNADWIKDFSYASPQVKIVEAQNIFEGNTLGGLLRDHSEVGIASLVYYSLHHNPLF